MEPMTAIIAEAIRSLGRTHPRITYEIEIGDTGSLVARLRARQLDVVTTRYHIAAADGDLNAAWLFRVPLVVVADRRNPLLRRRGLTLAALMDEPWALSPPETYLGGLVAAVFQRAGLPLPQATAVTISIAMRLGLIAGGRFLSVLPRTMLHQPANSAWLRALGLALPESAGAIAALTLRGRWTPGPVRLFLDALREVAPRMPGVDPM